MRLDTPLHGNNARGAKYAVYYTSVVTHTVFENIKWLHSRCARVKKAQSLPLLVYSLVQSSCIQVSLSGDESTGMDSGSSSSSDSDSSSDGEQADDADGGELPLPLQPPKAEGREVPMEEQPKQPAYVVSGDKIEILPVVYFSFKGHWITQIHLVQRILCMNKFI